MKKYYTVILSLILLILSIINNWYADQLIDGLVIFYIIPIIFLVILFNYLLITSFIKIFRDKKYENIISVIILTVVVLLYLYFPFRETKVNFELNRYEGARLEIIELIKKEELKAKDESRSVKLPNEYKKYSTSGEVVVYKNDEAGQVIGFWVFRGLLTGSVELIYSDGGKELIKDVVGEYFIVKLEKLKDKWYLMYID